MVQWISLERFSWDNLARIFRMYTIAILMISPLKVIISYPYYTLGLVENPLGTVNINDQALLSMEHNMTIPELCLYYKDIVVQNKEVEDFLKQQCEIATNLIENTQHQNIATAFLGTLLLLGKMIPDIIKTILILPYVVYSELHPYVQHHELAAFGLTILTAIWLIMHVLGLASVILFRVSR